MIELFDLLSTLQFQKIFEEFFFFNNQIPLGLHFSKYGPYGGKGFKFK